MRETNDEKRLSEEKQLTGDAHSMPIEKDRMTSNIDIHRLNSLIAQAILSKVENLPSAPVLSSNERAYILNTVEELLAPKLDEEDIVKNVMADAKLLSAKEALDLATTNREAIHFSFREAKFHDGHKELQTKNSIEQILQKPVSINEAFEDRRVTMSMSSEGMRLLERMVRLYPIIEIEKREPTQEEIERINAEVAALDIPKGIYTIKG